MGRQRYVWQHWALGLIALGHSFHVPLPNLVFRSQIVFFEICTLTACHKTSARLSYLKGNTSLSIIHGTSKVTLLQKDITMMRHRGNHVTSYCCDPPGVNTI